MKTTKTVIPTDSLKTTTLADYPPITGRPRPTLTAVAPVCSDLAEPGFTPGPWQADEWAPGWTVCAPDSHYSVCHLEGCNNAEANARLIAAAPSLLAALEMIVRHDYPQITGGDWATIHAAIAAAKAVQS